MKRLTVILCLLATLVFADSDPWRMNYEKGLQLIAQGNYDGAVEYLKMAAADRPISEIIQDGKERFEYLPYLQLGICYVNLKRPELATEYFELENSLRPIELSTGGKELMKQYQEKIKSPRNPNLVSADHSIRDYQKRPYLLSNLQLDTMKEEIRTRCSLPKASDESYPWYFHYELGKELENKGDWQRALESFIQALDHRDRPRKSSRIYGMWFVDYYPYYNIGLAHYRLQNWKCADNAFQLSQIYEDIPPDSSESGKLQEMRTEVQQKLLTEK